MGRFGRCFFLGAILIGMISSCGLQSSYLKMTDSRTAISPDDVQIFDQNVKPAEYTVLGKINIHAIQDNVGKKWWQPELKKKAAENGANGVIIEQMGSTGGFGRGYLDVVALAIYFKPDSSIERGESSSKYHRLKELKGLLDMGAITEEEYNREKAKILSD